MGGRSTRQPSSRRSKASDRFVETDNLVAAMTARLSFTGDWKQGIAGINFYGGYTYGRPYRVDTLRHAFQNKQGTYCVYMRAPSDLWSCYLTKVPPGNGWSGPTGRTVPCTRSAA